MKKVCLFAILLMASLVGTAQTHVNLVAAPQFNQRLGARAGVDVDVALGQSNFSFVPGLYWSMRNCSFGQNRVIGGVSQSLVDVKDISHWISVPLRFSYTVNKGNENFQTQFLVGPYFAIGLAGTTTFRDYEAGINHPKVDSFDKKGFYKRRYDVGLNLGVDFIIKNHLVVGVFGELGLLPMCDVTRFVDMEIITGAIVSVFSINSAAGINIGYRF